MRLKSLDIVGFKSFGDRTHLSFGDGITGIVGPNGCGKSNIVDAIRWVMGEMSAKNLRGRGMMDVIFAGSENRGPSGFSEVTLGFLNDGDVPPSYAAFSEISCTRRLHRDNTSEYFINKTPCRLRDITDLFLGTGVGTRAYSIIEQGRIGFVVSARPEDRRSLIEEVAGITKFKARRKAAERRMFATEQNLARVNDIVAELARQLASLKRQARKAERYKRVKAELRDLDLRLAAMQFLDLAARDRLHSQEQAKLEQRFDHETRDVATREAELEGERLLHLAEEERLQGDQTACATIESRLAALERDLTHWRQQLSDTRQQLQRSGEEGREAEARSLELQREREMAAAEQATIEESVGADQERLLTANNGVEELQAVLRRLDNEAEEHRREALEQVHEAARHHTQLANLEKLRSDSESRRHRAMADLEHTLKLGAAADHYHQQLEERLDGIARELDGWRQRREERHQGLVELTREVTEGEERLLALRSALAEARSRLESLEGIAQRLEGYADGVRTLLNPDGEPPGPVVAGILGLVTEFLRAQPKFERAIEAALGDKLQLVIVESHAAGMDAIRYLKQQAGGRGGLLPKQPRVKSAAPLPASQPGLVGAARDGVVVEPGYEAVADYLLGDVAVVEDLDAALLFWGQNGLSRTLVTLEGEVLDPGGALCGGSPEGKGLLAKAREIRELRQLVADFERQLAEAVQAQQEKEALRLQAEVDIQQLDKEIRQGEVEHIEVDKELEAAANEIIRLADRLEVLDHEMDQHRGELTRIARETAECTQVAARAEANKTQLEARLNELQQQSAALAEQFHSRNEALTSLRVDLASRAEKNKALSEVITRLDQTAAENQRRIARSEENIAAGETQLQELDSKIKIGDSEVAATVTEANQRRQQLAAARAAYEDKRQRLSAGEENLKEGRKGSEAVREALVGLKMERQRLHMERQQLIDLVAERHDVDLLLAVGDFHMAALPGPGEEQERERLERSLKNMGAINLMAIDECAEVETRHDFLVAQRDDLAAALESLRRAIRRINRTSRRRFRDAFNAVNEMFERVFPRLFRGGEARLELLEHEDVLEAGVDIFAQPPGKKLQNVSLLSGGEKALTAIALVFSIFLIKPSPFCVLDEVDAPLDDANVRRFNDILREIAKISQFVVITHNKLTMTEADRLYGITMEEPGLSKMVAVDLGSFDSEEAA